MGVLCMWWAATIGANYFFLMIRYVIGDIIQAKYAQKLLHFNQKIAQNGWFIIAPAVIRSSVFFG